jgi:hypothetical protein
MARSCPCFRIGWRATRKLRASAGGARYVPAIATDSFFEGTGLAGLVLKE